MADLDIHNYSQAQEILEGKIRAREGRGFGEDDKVLGRLKRELTIVKGKAQLAAAKSPAQTPKPTT